MNELFKKSSYVLFPIIIAIIPYLAMSFYFLSLDPTQWTEYARGSYGFLFVFSFGFGILGALAIND